ncbi:hypothetical protein ACRALDRAFT_208783, partial [Sodiomyces alcalophilus JCM 7366]
MYTYDHTHWKARDPVRSPIDKPVRAGLVVGSVTTSEYPTEEFVNDRQPTWGLPNLHAMTISQLVWLTTHCIHCLVARDKTAYQT